MSVMATFTLPANDFVLESLLAPNPGVRIRLERVIPLGDEVIPYFWASNGPIQGTEAVLEEADDIESFEIIDEVNEELLVRVIWSRHIDGFLPALAGSDATILEAVGELDVWRFQLRFRSRAKLTSFYRECATRGMHLDLERLHRPGATDALDGIRSLTDAQREALDLALRRGYFDVPRQTNVVELAEELDISDSAVSQRLRRGITALLSSGIRGPDTTAVWDQEPFTPE